jgi:hypothetical protein
MQYGSSRVIPMAVEIIRKVVKNGLKQTLIPLLKALWKSGKIPKRNLNQNLLNIGPVWIFSGKNDKRVVVHQGTLFFLQRLCPC